MSLKIINPKGIKINSTEESIINLINNKPDFFCSHSIQEVSKASNVSPSTMTRVCHKLNFKSFKALQMFVYEKSRMQTDYYKLSSESKTIEQIIHNVRGSALFTINETLNNIDHKLIEQISTTIYKSNRLIIFGLEEQQISARSFVNNLAKIDKSAFNASNIHNFSQRAIFFNNKDFVIFITRTGWTKEIIESIKWSFNKNIPFLVLTPDIETTKSLLGEEISNFGYMIETQTINNDRVKYPSISSVPGEMIVFDLIFNIIVELNAEFRDNFEKTNEISLNWNFKGRL